MRADGGTQRVDYRALAQRLLEDLNAFIDQLERSGRRVVLVIVPEHGAGLHGDRMQIAGMREIPSPSITHVPVGIKLIGMGSAARDEPLHVGAPSSYLALSEIIARLSVMSPVDDGGAGIDRHALVADLPQTAPVAENAGTVVLEYGGMSYVRIQEQGEWLPYPHRSQ
ncbi:cellulose biosynthesis protein BcsG [Aromatoleum anaerobium]|uniref:cellulose biosynthesis protein BcsG n=1 Tax=Aromatoleum anaerobium TaxID=182180 RepID=UPI001B7D0D2D|nr:cellulose biosynthesis protein BcsG [Aromatoleum anaerobium]MCK0508508.1 cellulose biosynthesis protein BcsG [Aromatoleum anaerobium]